MYIDKIRSIFREAFKNILENRFKNSVLNKFEKCIIKKKVLFFSFSCFVIDDASFFQDIYVCTCIVLLLHTRYYIIITHVTHKETCLIEILFVTLRAIG